jgi:hypothetical protein
MTALTRAQVDAMLTGLVSDKVDGVNVSRLLDHDAAQRERIRELEQQKDNLYRHLQETQRMYTDLRCQLELEEHAHYATNHQLAALHTPEEKPS